MVFSGFGIHPRRIVTWSKVLQVFQTRGSIDSKPSRADQCIRLKKNSKLNLYKYIAVSVDDVCIAAQDPKELINILKIKYQLKAKRDGSLTYHLGADYYH